MHAATTPRFIGPMLWVAVAVVVMPLVLQSTSLATEVLVFALGALSVTFLAGQIGLLSFGQGLFFGIGAYGSGMLAKLLSVGTSGSLLVGMLVAAAVGCVVGFMITHRKGVSFVMLTLAFAQMGFFIMTMFSSVTGGENGLLDIPRTPLLGGLFPLHDGYTIYVFIAFVYLIALMAVWRVVHSPAGSVLAGIRENESRIQALGYNARRYKAFAFAFAGAIAGLAGSLHTTFLGFVPPNVIQLEMSQQLLVMAIIGGTGSPFGALLGSMFYVVLSNVIASFWPRWMIIIALLLVTVVLFLRGGLLEIGQTIQKKLLKRTSR
ncbi:branched-chain amino acid ABC transporter permease [Paralcaligenes ureilyticus]|uniref:Amino acid/amide ABC transporter membrane protein 2 (HAAT family) n=1 Tax=Paralcaligenes ureilyticus TaxID=627131 RepID=A0A4R3M8F5_9BURK|nr:branched-chain amino acid ABC transporter permease [Paralcaligenes ureilyticus]TCT09660.1 amino acid/amide ABC transporter membrane protein 2 (HAAT family) [Paralcaligenes ureilyticus]